MKEISDTAIILITLGSLFLIGLLIDALGRRTRLPRVTLLMLFGVIVGSGGLNLMPELGEKWFPTVANIALVMVGFLLGEKFIVSDIKRHGRLVLGISVSVVLVTTVLVFLGLYITGVGIECALLLAVVATATAPTATSDVVHETQAKGIFSRTLLGIVAVDDAWGLILFSMILAVIHSFTGSGEILTLLASGAWEIGGAILVGVILGIPAAYITGRVRPGEPTLVEALGVVFLCGGIAIWMDVSFLLASMVLGAVVANFARHHIRPFHAIEDIEWPFMILFFVLAGASLQVESLLNIGFIGIAYIIFRIIGRLFGAWLGGVATKANQIFRRWMGLALMPQAGVAIGMALVAAQNFPELSEIILPVIIGSTVFFELVGPVFTRLALDRAREIK